MQHHRNAFSRRTPPPDIVRSSGFTTPASPAPPSLSHPSHHPASPDPEFLIIGIFALRLTKSLIGGLEYYPGRDDDVAWLTNFLAPYPPEFALAKIFGPRMEDYIATYQNIISRMKRQPRYPLRFMHMNPDQSMRQQPGGHIIEREGTREMTDLERLNIIDFCDAACEWGSIVPIPAKEAERMIELADQRRIVDLSNRRPVREDGEGYEGRRR